MFRVEEWENLCATGAQQMWRLSMRSSMCFCPGSSVAAYTISTQAWSMAIGSSDAMMPMSAMQGFSATAQQSQSTDRFFITLM